MAKKINLAPRDKPKSKKPDKYDDSPLNEYKFEPKDKVIYVKTLNKYNGLECTIVKRSKRKSTQYYHVEFDNGEKLEGVSSGFLRTLEEYELELERAKNKTEDNNEDNATEEELKILNAGLIPMKNLRSCHNQDALYHRGCTECGYESVCIYEKKYKYNEVNFN